MKIQKKLILKELKVRQAELEDSQDLGSTESRGSLLLIEELNLGENGTEVLNMDLEKIRIQQWINNIPSVHTFADKSISLSFRSGKAESFETVKGVPEVEGIGCNEYHHSLLHNDRRSSSQGIAQTTEIEKIDEVLNHCIVDRGVLLRIIPIILSGPEGEFSTFALFDEASTVTLVSEHITDRIGATGQVDGRIQSPMRK
ncbi:hypothetical protein JTB14_009035 [Gonioctena quinquepunctata]|nr:hypothetical protein JTB14_009035 [Gonioctena quinquepunctata]